MSKKSSTPPLSALSVQHAHELEAVERNFQRALENCFDAYGCIVHPVKADEYMRSYAVKFFSIYLAAYASTSLPLWIPGLKNKAIEWVLTAISNYSGVEQEQLREFFKNLDETLDEYLKTFRFSPNPLLSTLADPDRADSTTSTLNTKDQVASRQASGRQQIKTPKETPPALVFAVELERLLIEARYTPESIAEVVGINWRTVYRHRKGEIQPSLKNVGAYEKALSKLLNRKITLPTPVRRQSVAKRQ